MTNIFKTTSTIVLAIFSVLFTALVANSQCIESTNYFAGKVDSCFNSNLLVSGLIYDLALQTDGKIIIGGFVLDGANGSLCLARINSDGSLDTEFNIGTGPDLWVTASKAVPFVSSIEVQDNGKIIVAGNFNLFDYQDGDPYVDNIIRLNADGSQDLTFQSNWLGGIGGEIYDIALQQDNKILVVGSFLTFNGINRRKILRLNPDGTLDTGFNPGTGFYQGMPNTLAIQENGKIIIGGTFTSYNGTTANNIVRLNSDGSIDPTFNSGTGFYLNLDNFYGESSVQDIQLSGDGKLLVGGKFTSYNTTLVNNIVRLNQDGSLDNSFTPWEGFTPSLFQSDLVTALALLSDGKILVGGQFANPLGWWYPDHALVRLNENGTIDDSFMIVDAQTNFSSVMEIRKILLQPDSKILLGGNHSISINQNQGYTQTGISRIYGSTSSEVGQNEFKDEIRRGNIYPNPANSEIILDGIQQPTSLCIYNLQGSMICSEIMYPSTSLKIDHLSDGVYFWRSEAGGFGKLIIRE